MATSLDNIIAAIKDVALNQASFTSVQDFKLNLDSNADTMLDKLFIKLVNISYEDFRIDTANETYRLELIIIINCTSNPISNLKAKMDLLLNKMFTTNNLLANLVLEGKLTLVNANLTNDRDLYSKYGGEMVSLTIDINNINAFGLTPCS